MHFASEYLKALTLFILSFYRLHPDISLQGGHHVGGSSGKTRAAVARTYIAQYTGASGRRHGFDKQKEQKGEKKNVLNEVLSAKETTIWTV